MQCARYNHHIGEREPSVHRCCHGHAKWKLCSVVPCVCVETIIWLIEIYVLLHHSFDWWLRWWMKWCRSEALTSTNLNGSSIHTIYPFGKFRWRTWFDFVSFSSITRRRLRERPIDWFRSLESLVASANVICMRLIVLLQLLEDNDDDDDDEYFVVIIHLPNRNISSSIDVNGVCLGAVRRNANQTHTHIPSHPSHPSFIVFILEIYLFDTESCEFNVKRCWVRAYVRVRDRMCSICYFYRASSIIITHQQIRSKSAQVAAICADDSNGFESKITYDTLRSQYTHTYRPTDMSWIPLAHTRLSMCREETVEICIRIVTIDVNRKRHYVIIV